MSEVVGVTLLFLGLLILMWGLGWLTLLVYRSRGAIAALASWIVGPFGPLFYGLIHFSKARRPLMVVLLGLILGAVPFAYGHGYELIFGLGERERMLNGERHLVLTGWDRPTYDILKSRTDTVVLELANVNVTDETLMLLKPFSRLRELTLNDSSITDAAFVTLKDLKSIESLRLARTGITKDGLAEFLSDPPPRLKEIDVSGNSISASALRKWRNQDSENRRYVN